MPAKKATRPKKQAVKAAPRKAPAPRKAAKPAARKPKAAAPRAKPAKPVKTKSRAVAAPPPRAPAKPVARTGSDGQPSREAAPPKARMPAPSQVAEVRATFAGMQFYWSNFQDVGLVDIVSAIFSLLVTVALLKVWRPATVMPVPSCL